VGLESLGGGLRLWDSCFSAGFGIAAFPCPLQAAMGAVLGALQMHPPSRVIMGGMLQHREGFGGAGGGKRVGGELWHPR